MSLTITRPDPTGAYQAIDDGWADNGMVDGMHQIVSRTTANGGVFDGALVADKGLITVGPITVTNGSGTGIATDVSGDPDTVTITLTSGATMSALDADVVIDVADADSGSFGTGVIAAGSQTPATNGVIQLTNGGLGANWDGTITYKENRDEAVVTKYSYQVPVIGANYLKLIAPDDGDGEVKLSWEYATEDYPNSGSSTLTWTNFVTTDAATGETIELEPEAAGNVGDTGKTAKQLLLEIRKVRLAVIATDADTDGVASIEAAMADGDTKVLMRHGPMVKTQDTATIGGIGADPS